MTGLHKFSLKKYLLAFTAFAFFCAITWKSQARHIVLPEIYSTLTTDTSKPLQKDTLRSPQQVLRQAPSPAIVNAADTIPDSSAVIKRTDTVPQQRTDTFSLRISKDTLAGPVNYEAEDSAVVYVEAKKIVLYGNTKTTYQDVNLQAPKVQMDQSTNLVTAYNSRDSLGDVISRAQFEQGENKFESDTIQFNFKTQKGLTKNTYTQQQEMFVQGEDIKKVDANTFFVKHGRFTTCNLDDPHFAFTSNKIKVINNKAAITGPTHPEFESVPVPIYLPFGYFPLSKGRHSGLLPVEFTVNEEYGLGLEGIGYYKVLNDNLDVMLRGDVYSYGSWRLNLTPTYRKRYRYNGTFNFSLQHSKLNFKGDPDYSLTKTFFVSWSHSVDQRARPGTNFSANVNAGSTKYNQYIPNNAYRNFQNQLTSSIAYSKTWAGKPYNLTLSANHNQNNNSGLINLTLPDAGFTVSTIYPFQRKEMVGTPKWYERLGVGYNGVARNQLSFYDTGNVTMQSLLDTLNWGAQHRIPISLSLPPLGPLVVAPNISYEETWLTHRIHRGWDATNNKLDTLSKDEGFFIDRQMSFGLSLSSALYGTFRFKNSRVTALRHVVRPNFSINYRPNLSSKYYDIIQTDSGGTKFRPYSQFEGNYVFTGYSYGRFGGISFGIDNNLEMKVRSKKDTSAGGERKVRLIDGFGVNSGYNFLADSLSPKLQPFSLYLRSTLFEKINLTATALLDPYAVNEQGIVDYSRYVWQEGRFTPGRITNASISLSTDFRSKTRDGKEPEPRATNQPQITDPALLADQDRLMDYMRLNPAQFVDFNIPWSVSIGFNLSMYRRFNTATQQNESSINSNLNFNGSFSLTPKWNFSTNGYYDFNTMALQTLTMSINREMHCWQLSINVAPVGQWRYFSFTINPKSAILQDLRINRTRSFSDF